LKNLRIAQLFKNFFKEVKGQKNKQTVIGYFISVPKHPINIFRMEKTLSLILVLFAFLNARQPAQAQQLDFKDYHNPKEINTALTNMQKQNSNFTKIHTLSQSAGGQDVLMLQIDAKKPNSPAVFVIANLEGVFSIASEGALYLAKSLVNEQPENYNWYIVPSGNPDAATHFFMQPQVEFSGNASQINLDRDEQSGEDAWNDLDKNGFITQMRVKRPDGKYIADSDYPLLLRKANPEKGECGIYKIFPEGTDDDGDGKINEDPAGGVNIGITFPHLFESYKPEAGLFPGSEELTFQIMKFMDEHPEIIMSITLGGADFCIAPPKGDRKGNYSSDKIKIPKQYAERFGADPNKNYSMEEILEMVQKILPPSVEATESMVISFLGLGAIVNPRPNDLKYYSALAAEYKDFLKEQKFNTKRLDPIPAKDGSFELHAYYQLGLYSFAMNFFTLPKPEKSSDDSDEDFNTEKIKKMSPEEFLQLEDDKINDFLKKNGQDKQYSAEKIKEAVKAGQITPAVIAQMLEKQSKSSKDKNSAPKKDIALYEFYKNTDTPAFLEWKSYEHPTLGLVEIGGKKPFLANNPPPEMIDSLLSVQSPWLIKLTEKLPKLSLGEIEIKNQGGGIYRIDVWVDNKGYLPYPTEMGQKNKANPPVVILIESKKINFLSGNNRKTLEHIGGHASEKVSFNLHAESSETIEIIMKSANAGQAKKSIKLQ